jgi:hypothetical protein
LWCWDCCSLGKATAKTVDQPGVVDVQSHTLDKVIVRLVLHVLRVQSTLARPGLVDGTDSGV